MTSYGMIYMQMVLIFICKFMNLPNDSQLFISMQNYRLQLGICLEIQPFKLSVSYGIFALVTKTLV